jgi:hypothetical protein
MWALLCHGWKLMKPVVMVVESLFWAFSHFLQPSPSTFSEVFTCMFEYIDRIFAIVRPRKLLFMAIGL